MCWEEGMNENYNTLITLLLYWHASLKANLDEISRGCEQLTQPASSHAKQRPAAYSHSSTADPARQQPYQAAPCCILSQLNS
jgi:hypothetical protein